MTAQTDLADRYGVGNPRKRVALIGVIVVLGAALAGWAAWTVWEQSNPEVSSELVAYDIVSEHSVVATVAVDLADDDVEATCKVRAYAEDHSVVGEVNFTPTGSGRSEQTIRTERAATAVELIGCTAPGQSRPR